MLVPKWVIFAHMLANVKFLVGGVDLFLNAFDDDDDVGNGGISLTCSPTCTGVAACPHSSHLAAARPLSGPAQAARVRGVGLQFKSQSHNTNVYMLGLCLWEGST